MTILFDLTGARKRLNKCHSLRMNRQHLKTTDEQVVAEFGHILNLFSKALSHASNAEAFYRRFNAAAAQGRTWVEALEHAVNAKDPA